jgi:hypothetical protein
VRGQSLRRLRALALAVAPVLGCKGEPWLLGEPSSAARDAGLDAGADAASASACPASASPSDAADAGVRGELSLGQLGRWQADITGTEAQAFPASSIALEILADRIGSLQLESTLALPTLVDGTGGYLCSAPGPSTCTSASGFIAGFDYSLLLLSARDSILSFRVDIDQPWQAWCELQVPIVQPRAGCMPRYGVEAPYSAAASGETCSVTRASGPEAIDCARLATVERNPCACTRERCEFSRERGLTVNLRLVSPDRLEGALWFDSEHALVLRFARPKVSP